MVERAAGASSGRIGEVREKALDMAASAREQVSGGAGVVRKYIVNEPTRALGIALGMGVLLGWLIKRR